MKITIIGHICLDTILHPDGVETRSFGGIFFSVVAMANLLGPRDTVYPVFGVGRDDYEHLMERLKSYPNIDPSGIYKFDGPTNHVRLVYTSAAERVECSKDISQPIPLNKIQPYLKVNMILVNMISGFDITLETLDEIRMEVREHHAPLYLDVHSITLDLKDDFTREHRPVPEWRRWLFMVHAAQLNEQEAATLTPERLDDASFANHALALNTNALVITRGEQGCTMFITEHKHVQRHDIAGIPTGPSSVDPTGCGDVFAAAYCAHYMKTGAMLPSVEFANRVAAAKARFAGSSEIDSLSSFRLTELSKERSGVA